VKGLPQVSRRRLLTGAAAGGGLLLAWTVWPRDYGARLATSPGETALGAFLKIDTSGQVIVMVPQAEMGQGVFTLLPQILADELGADWRTVAVQPAPPSALYANTLFASTWMESDLSRATGSMGTYVLEEIARRETMMLTGGATSIPMFRDAYQEAGAAARALLCQAAAARWDVDWETCDIRDGLVTDGKRTLKFGELAAEAATFPVPEMLPYRAPDRDDTIIGTELPRLDVPAKIDGSANYAADIRLPDMIFASIRQGPVGAGRLLSMNEAAARKVPGVVGIVRRDGWVAVTASNWWAANQALGRLDPVFDAAGPLLDDALIARALDAGLNGDGGRRFYAQGDLASVFDGATIATATYSAAPALHLALEPMAATARVREGDVEVWMPTQAPVFARRAIADALGVRESSVTVYPLFAGGSFDRKLDHEAGVQAAFIAREAKVPVQLMWSRSEDIVQDRPRPPAKARMAARLGPGGLVRGLSARVAMPAALAETWRRVAHGESAAEARAYAGPGTDRAAVSGLVPPYAIPNLTIDHYPVDIPLPTGRWRANADSLNAFFVESFMDELAQISSVEPLSFRMQMLGGNPRLARCLTSVATLGGWQGGIRGSGQGLACHMMQGGCIAVLVQAALAGGHIRIERVVATADIGAPINPMIARQQIEGGLIFGLASAMGGGVGYKGALPHAMRMGAYGLPRMADIGEVSVELVRSSEPALGMSEIGVPAAAPALANALATLTGRRMRSLPLTGVAQA
jgi:isoquinoline 1-oxidoreductase beta subunit